MKKLFFIIEAYLIVCILDLCRTFLPSQFATEEAKVKKSTVSFSLYLVLLQIYIWGIHFLQRKDPKLSEEVQRILLGRIFKTIFKIKWWKMYFEKHGIEQHFSDPWSLLKKIPPINRTTILDVPKIEMTSQIADMRRIQENSTSGSTTGTPFITLFDRSVRNLNVTAQHLAFYENMGFSFRINYRKNFLVHFNLFGGVRVLTSGPEQFATSAIAKGEGELKQEITSIVLVMRKIGRPIFFTHPSELRFFTQKISDLNLRPPLELCLLIGQMVDRQDRLLSEQYLKCPVIPIYGLREFMHIAVGCKDYPDLYHTFTERAVIEILREDGTPTAINEFGQLTITGLDNHVMPLIRYQPGDIARFTAVRCTCSYHGKLFEIRDRTSDIFHFKDGSRRPARKLFKIFGEAPFVTRIRRFQIRQIALDKIEVLVESRDPKEELMLEKSLAKKIYKKRIIPDDVVVSIVWKKWIDDKGLKFKPFVSLKS